MAQLIIDIFGRRTSVLFDLSAITDLVQAALDSKDDNTEEKVSLLSNILYFSLVHIYQNKDGQCSSKELQVSFNNFWKLA